MLSVMEWLNYQHLFYFWTVVRSGTVLAASEQLRLSPSTISEQLRTLEEVLGEKLLRRAGRTLVPTETGVVVFRYADEIFTTGRELLDTLKGRPTGRPMRLVVGIADVVPKNIVRRLIEPARRLEQPVYVVCREASTEQLLARLAIQELDVVLTDAPIGPSAKVRAYNHLLGKQAQHLWPRPPWRGHAGASSRAAWMALRCCCRPTTPPFAAISMNGWSRRRCVLHASANSRISRCCVSLDRQARGFSPCPACSRKNSSRNTGCR
jgi:DNA-binding transcriptional LysR family regulator